MTGTAGSALAEEACAVPVPPPPALLVEAVYGHLNASRLDAALRLMAPDICWSDAIFTGERLHGHDALRRHWRKILAVLRPRIEVRGLRPSGTLLVVDALQSIADPTGKPLAHQEVRHVLSFDPAGRVARLEAREPGPGPG
ncbi:MAG: nuclear transport factor 2 family protein [Actinobacteria bacterium]|nr:nuclear transport factor 2 family protein [Actinomycetota bacterium]